MSTRDLLRREIQETQHEFHQLLDSAPEEAFSLPSDNPAWTVGEVFYHMSIAPRLMVHDVKIISKQNWLFRLIPRIVPQQVFDWLNAHLTRFGARNMSRSFLAESYDRATASILRVLDSLSDADFARSVTYPQWDPLLSGDVTIAYLFGYIRRHFQSHAAQLQPILQAEKGQLWQKK